MRGFLKQKNNIWVILAYFGGVCPPLGPPEGHSGPKSILRANFVNPKNKISKLFQITLGHVQTCPDMFKHVYQGIRPCTVG